MAEDTKASPPPLKRKDQYINIPKAWTGESDQSVEYKEYRFENDPYLYRRALNYLGCIAILSIIFIAVDSVFGSGETKDAFVALASASIGIIGGLWAGGSGKRK